MEHISGKIFTTKRFDGFYCCICYTSINKNQVQFLYLLYKQFGFLRIFSMIWIWQCIDNQFDSLYWLPDVRFSVAILYSFNWIWDRKIIRFSEFWGSVFKAKKKEEKNPIRIFGFPRIPIFWVFGILSFHCILCHIKKVYRNAMTSFKW